MIITVITNTAVDSDSISCANNVSLSLLKTFFRAFWRDVVTHFAAHLTVAGVRMYLLPSALLLVVIRLTSLINDRFRSGKKAQYGYSHACLLAKFKLIGFCLNITCTLCL